MKRAVALFMLMTGAAQAQTILNMPNVSTPLAGTETMYIVQGTNPTDKNITVQQLGASMLPFALPTAVQGDTLYYNGTAWTVLPPGTTGQFLKTLGNGANPTWGTASGSGTVTSVGLSSPSSSITLGGTNPVTISGTIQVDVNNAHANHWTAVQSFDSGDFVLNGASSGTLTMNAAATAGTNTITWPAGTTNFTATGGASQVLRQSSGGAAITVGQLACGNLSDGATSCSTDTTNASNITSGTLAAARGGAGTINGALKGNGSGVVSQAACADLSNGGTACTKNTGTSGANVPLLNGTNVWSGQQSDSVTSLSISTATYTPDGSNNDYTLTLVHASCPCTLANPSATPVAGTAGQIVVVQSATGSDTIGTYGSSYVASGGTASLTLSTGANAIDILSYYVIDSTHIALSLQTNFSH